MNGLIFKVTFFTKMFGYYRGADIIVGGLHHTEEKNPIGLA